MVERWWEGGALSQRKGNRPLTDIAPSQPLTSGWPVRYCTMGERSLLVLRGNPPSGPIYAERARRRRW